MKRVRRALISRCGLLGNCVSRLQVLHQSATVQDVVWDLLSGLLLELPVQHPGCGKVSACVLLPTIHSRWLEAGGGPRGAPQTHRVVSQSGPPLSGGGSAHSGVPAALRGHQVRPFHRQRHSDAVSAALLPPSSAAGEFDLISFFPLTAGSDKSTTTSACEAAPTFCTNRTGGTRRRGRRVSAACGLLGGGEQEVVTSRVVFCSRRRPDETDPGPEGRVHGLHLPLPEPLLLPRGLRGHAPQSGEGLQVHFLLLVVSKGTACPS